MIFKCALAIWLRSLTVQISYVSSTGEVNHELVKLRAVNTGNIVAKSFVNVNIFEKNIKFAMLIKLYP